MMSAAIATNAAGPGLPHSGAVSQIAPRTSPDRSSTPPETESVDINATPPTIKPAAAIPRATRVEELTMQRGYLLGSTLLDMPIDIDIAHVARLARLDLDDEALETYRRQLGIILDHAAKVQAVEADGLEPTAHPLGLTNAFRSDEVRPSLEREEVLSQAPEHRDGYFVAPPAMEGE